MAELIVKTTCPYCQRAAEHRNPWEVAYTRSGIPIYSRRKWGEPGNPENGSFSTFSSVPDSQ